MLYAVKKIENDAKLTNEHTKTINIANATVIKFTKEHHEKLANDVQKLKPRR